MTSQSYLQVPTRIGIDGARDKAALIYSLALWTAQTNRDFLNRVRDTVNGCDSAESQIKKWFDFCCSKTYSREWGDVFAHPNDSARHGGDCDDTTILLLAGILTLGIPACPDVVIRNGNGAHVRVRVGLPPHSPPKDLSQWIILDPSKESESKWVGNTGKTSHTPQTTSDGFGSYRAYNDAVSSGSALLDRNAIHGLNAIHGDVHNDKFSLDLSSVAALLLVAFSGFYLKSYFENKNKELVK